MGRFISTTTPPNFFMAAAFPFVVFDTSAPQTWRLIDIGSNKVHIFNEATNEYLSVDSASAVSMTTTVSAANSFVLEATPLLAPTSFVVETNNPGTYLGSSLNFVTGNATRAQAVTFLPGTVS